MMEYIRRILFGPSPEEMDRRELDQARRELRIAQTAAEHAIKIVEFNTERIKRLRQTMTGQDPDNLHP